MADLDQLETRRLELETNVAKLRKSLQYWRTWDAEYEGLKEELTQGVNPQSKEDCVRISEEFGGELVNEKEILDLFGVGKSTLKNPAEVVGLVNRRLDYVQQNISTISKQVEKLAIELSEVLETIDRENDDVEAPELPITEIIEELDEDGNIVSSKVTQPEDSTAQIVETLRKAGLSELNPKSSDSNKKNVTSGSTTNDKPLETSPKDKASPSTATTNGTTQEETSKPAKKGVTFASEVQEKEIPSRSEDSKPTTGGPNTPLFAGSFAPGTRVVELDENDNAISSQAIIPPDESPEDARLRHEMLQYSLNEVGQVVAELDLDENLSEFEDSDYEFEDEFEDSEVEEEEDEHGRSVRSGISRGYREQMRELEERLRDKVIGNLGPGAETDPVYDPEELKRLVVRGEDAPVEENVKPAGKEAADVTAKKGVRFAEELDIQEAPKPTTAAAPPQRTTAPISNVIERTPTQPTPPPPTTTPPTKPSRFKQNLTSTQQQQPQPILTPQILERPSTTTPQSAPSTTNEEDDPALQQRQLASEYYRMRNNIIRQQGGFKESEEDREEPLMEEVDGRVRKVSRFKAARMKF